MWLNPAEGVPSLHLKEALMFGRGSDQRSGNLQKADNGQANTAMTLLTVVGDHARMEGKFDIADSIQIECEVGG